MAANSDSEIESARKLAQQVQEEYAQILIDLEHPELPDEHRRKTIIDLDFLETCYITESAKQTEQTEEFLLEENSRNSICENQENATCDINLLNETVINDEDSLHSTQSKDLNEVEDDTKREDIKEPSDNICKQNDNSPENISKEIPTLIERSVSNDKEFSLLSNTVEELITTEVDYLRSIHYLERKFLKPIGNTFKTGDEYHISMKMRNVIKMMHRFGSEFFVDLSVKSTSFSNVGNIFIQHQRLFNLYTKLSKCWISYSRIIDNDKTSHLIKNIEMEQKEALGFSRYIVKPMQRLAKYELFLRSIQKHLKRLDKMDELPVDHPIEKACRLIHDVLTLCNTIVAVQSIEYNKFDELQTGEFILRESLTEIHKVGRHKEKRDVEMFLFQNVVVIAVNIEESLQFADAILVEHLRKWDKPHKLHFVLEDFNELKSKRKAHNIILKAPTASMKQKCVKAIDDLLWRQLKQLKEEVSSQFASQTTSL